MVQVEHAGPQLVFVPRYMCSMTTLASMWEQIEAEKLAVRWIPTEYQYSDPLTKRLEGHMLEQAMITGMYSVPQFLRNQSSK